MATIILFRVPRNTASRISAAAASLHDVVLLEVEDEAALLLRVRALAEPVLAVVIGADAPDPGGVAERLRDSGQHASHVWLNLGDHAPVQGSLSRVEAALSLAAHDIRAPLSVISGAVNELTHPTVGQLNDEQRALVGLMRRSIDRLGHLATNLSVLAKLGAGSLQLSRRRVDLCVAIRDIARKVAAGEDAAALHVSVQTPDAPVFVEADTSMLALAVGNVLSNALRFARADIRISVAVTAGAIQVEIEDDGHGIPEGKGDIFERLPSESRIGQSGSGLGLAIVKGIVVAHGGSVHAENERGDDGTITGARFVLSLPMVSLPISAPPA